LPMDASLDERIAREVLYMQALCQQVTL
jgi:hypothetical protein